MKKRKAWNCGTGKSVEDKFWSFVIKTNTCWQWTGNLVGMGYGSITTWHKGKCKGHRAHRVSWMLHFGEIPKGLNVLHKCDNPACTNPEHLWLGTHAENVADKVKKHRQARRDTHGSKTMPHKIRRGIDHWMARLSIDDIIKIRNTDTSIRGTRTALAKQFKVSKTQIMRILARTSWKSIP